MSKENNKSVDQKKEDNTDNIISTKKYSKAEDYQVLGDIEHIRLRPGQYVSGVDEQAFHHLFQEALDNCIDEAVAGHSNWIKVTLSADQTIITVEDNGHGVPISIHHQTGQSVLVTLFTFLKSGGKFGEKIYKTAGGLHGIGVTAINALSEYLKVWNRRQGQTQIVEFSRGNLKLEQVIASPDVKDGFTITFKPDHTIFKESRYFKVDILDKRLRELAYLNPGLTLVLQSHPNSEPFTYYFSSGIVGWIKEIVQDNYLVGTEICSGEWSSEEPYFYLNFAWQYCNQQKTQIRSFCNNISTAAGGTHVDGFEYGLVNAVRDWVKEKKYSQLKSDINILKEDVLEGLVTVLAIRMKNATFAGQTKEKLSDKYVRDLVRNSTYDLVIKFLQDHSSVADVISQKIILTARNRIKTEEYQKTLREGGRGVSIPSKLTPCIVKDVNQNELFLVEGESAGGTGKSARDPYNQAILTLKGKVLNVEKADAKKVFANVEITNLFNALGYSVNEATQNYYVSFHQVLDSNIIDQEYELSEEFKYYDDQGQIKIIPAQVSLSLDQLKIIVEETKKNLLKKLRYGKIIIMTDADEDGKHIASILSSFFARYFRYLVEERHLYLAVPPLYCLRGKKEIRYFYSDHELDLFRQEHQGNISGQLQRFKGLGEMNAEQLRETTMNARRRCLQETNFEDPKNIFRIIHELMGIDSSFRRYYLEKGEHKNAELTVFEDNKVNLGENILVKFLNYAYKVVEDRALSDAKDSLKPVQRRILYTLYELNLWPNRPYRKSSKISGDVTGNFHPHGFESVYASMVSMAQDFNYRYPLIDPQGNWGSRDGDSAAAQRYTEARLSKFGLFLLSDLDFDTVEWQNNYDDTRKEPVYLPPNLNILLNGSSGIAVGMSTNIPSHNLGEITEATLKLIQNPEITLDELLTVIQGPDFATAATAYIEKDKLRSIYEKGEGTIYLRAKAEIFPADKDNKDGSICISELPFRISKSSVVQEINQIIKNKAIEGLKNVEDYSSLEQPVNIYIRFDSRYDGEVILNQLFKSTKLQSTFAVKMRMLINKQPKVLALKEILQNFITWRLEHIRKKARFVYNQNKKELENLTMRRFIIDNYREILEIIRHSSSEDEIKNELNNRFQLKTGEINRIIDSPVTFRQFAPEKKEKLQNDIANLESANTKQQLIINDPLQRTQCLVKELQELKKEYVNDVRRTLVINKSHYITERQLISREDRVAIFSYIDNKKENKVNNYITIYNLSFLEPTNIPSQGKEVKTRGNGWALIKLNRRDDLLCFTNYGKVFLLNFYKLNAVNKVTNLDEEYFIRSIKGKAKPLLYSLEYFTAILPLGEENEKDLLIVTKKGRIKLYNKDWLLKIGKSGKQLFKWYYKVTKKCYLHEEQIRKHKEDVHVCGFSCSLIREIYKEVKICSECRFYWNKEDDEIIKASLVKESEENLELVIKRKVRNNRFKNWRVPVFQTVRKKILLDIDGEKRKIDSYCSRHQELVIQHIKEHKLSENSCHIACSKLLLIRKNIKSCENCQHNDLFTKRIKKQIRCEQVVDIIASRFDKLNDSLLITVREGNLLEKKPFNRVKKWIGSDGKLKRTNYCHKHWFGFEELKKRKENANILLEDEKKQLENRIIKSSLSLEDKKKLLLKTQLVSSKSIAKDLLRKIDNSSIDELMSLEAKDEQINNFLNYGLIYQKLLHKYQEIENDINQFKEKNIDNCSDCQKYCDKHQKKNEEVIHQNCLYCRKNEHAVKQLRDEIELIESKINSANEKERNSEPIIINKLIQQLKIKKKQKEKMNYEEFARRISCPILNKFRRERKECKYCQKQIQKKYSVELDNSVKRVFLIDRLLHNPEIYLLMKENICCWYNKKDLLHFLQSETVKSKNILRDKTRIIDSIAFYSTPL